MRERSAHWNVARTTSQPKVVGSSLGQLLIVVRRVLIHTRNDSCFTRSTGTELLDVSVTRAVSLGQSCQRADWVEGGGILGYILL